MCRRFVVNAKPAAIAKEFNATVEEAFQANKIFAPGDQVPVIVHSKKSGDKELRTARFGLIPSFAIDPSVGKKLYNCRSETVDIKPSFRASFEARRCLIPATGFYEWHLHNKEPHLISPAEGELMAFAGIWDRWRDNVNGDVVISCAIITTEAAGPLAEIHQRMPAILDKAAQEKWLDSKAKQEDLKPLLKPYTKLNIVISNAVMAA